MSQKNNFHMFHESFQIQQEFIATLFVSTIHVKETLIINSYV